MHLELHSFPTRRSSDLGTNTARSSVPASAVIGANIRASRSWKSRNVATNVTRTSAPNDATCSQYGELCTARTADRKSTRLNSSHQIISYAVFCLKKKN